MFHFSYAVLIAIAVIWQCCFPAQKSLVEALSVWAKIKRGRPGQSQVKDAVDAEYDLVIVGAGASGLFATGAALSFGMKTLLLDQTSKGKSSSNNPISKYFVGGDCTNAACVPSKALRSVSRMAFNGQLKDKEASLMEMARDHTFGTVAAVRKREDVAHYENVTNLDLAFCEYDTCQFVSNNELEYQDADPQWNQTMENTSASSPRKRKRIRAKKFLIATGASPIIPEDILRDATTIGLPLYTYRDILSPPESDESSTFWKQFCDEENTTKRSNNNNHHIVIAGGGPTAVELAQSLVRIQFNVTIVAPTLLSAEDASLQQAACSILRHDGVNLVLGKRVARIDVNDQTVVLRDDDDDESIISANRLQADAMVACMGRRPAIASLNLSAANVAWDDVDGVQVNPDSLRSRTNPRVFACGDCCSAVSGKDRKAAHAGWTGFMAIRNLALPRILWVGSPSVHPTVPSVTYADPELASVGLTRSECIERHGQDGFIYQSIREEGNDRADMERLERNVEVSFVELRAEKYSGRILGLTACGPAAAELANEIGLAVQSKLTVRDVARSMHSYPSHGYLLYRLALSMLLSSTSGFLDTLGPAGRGIGKAIGVLGIARNFHPNKAFPWRRQKTRKQRQWEAVGERSVIIANSTEGNPMSFLERYKKEMEGPVSATRTFHSKAYSKWKESKQFKHNN